MHSSRFRGGSSANFPNGEQAARNYAKCFVTHSATIFQWNIQIIGSDGKYIISSLITTGEEKEFP